MKTFARPLFTRGVAVAALVAAGLAALPAASAQELKIGYVNSERLMRESAPAQAAQKKLQAEFSRRERELVEAEQRLKAAADRLEKDAPVPRRYYIERVDAPARRLVGPWRSKAARGRALSRLPARERDRARLVRKGGKFYAELGQARILGPWADPDSRARAARALTARGERVRSFSRPAVRTGSAAVDELGQTT